MDNSKKFSALLLQCVLLELPTFQHRFNNNDTVYFTDPRYKAPDCLFPIPYDSLFLIFITLYLKPGVLNLQNEKKSPIYPPALLVNRCRL